VGGGDGTASFALFILFSALVADDARADEGLKDTGNGFIWDNQELEEFFPAMAQMPLGSANDFAHVLGWGQKYPGARQMGKGAKLAALWRWVEAIIDPARRLANFDIWGLMPEPGSGHCNFKICELTGNRGLNPKQYHEGQWQLVMKEACSPIPLFSCLYFTAGFGGYMISRFQLNRRNTPLQNRAEYARQICAILAESLPPQLSRGLDDVEVHCSGEKYFPPRGEDQGSKYQEVGFLNINWAANKVHGADRADLLARAKCCGSVREAVDFGDGKMDMLRAKKSTMMRCPNATIQTDKKDDMTLRFSGKKGTGLFFQWDGEARFAFSPSGDQFSLHVRKILNVPVVLGPEFGASSKGSPTSDRRVKFEFSGINPEAQEEVKERVMKNIRGELNSEMCATAAEMRLAGLVHHGDFKNAM
jgi:hypothetical protein